MSSSSFRASVLSAIEYKLAKEPDGKTRIAAAKMYLNKFDDEQVEFLVTALAATEDAQACKRLAQMVCPAAFADFDDEAFEHLRFECQRLVVGDGDD